MGRNKFAGPLSKREKKLKEEGKFHLRPDGHTLTDGYFSQGEPQHKRRMVAVELFSGTLISLRKGGGLWFFARYTKGYYGKIFLDRGPRQERSTLDAVQAARTARCAGEAAAGPRAKRPSCDGVK